jgi:hypothetical protein
LISVDLVSGVDNNTMMILSNSEVIAVNQDPLGVQGIRVSDGGSGGQKCVRILLYYV